ncbi:MAG: group 1 glycosyl transferase [Bacteroidetes bacterium 43-93]|nr:glycosyltransferase family 4 protein [Bacteroidota bacterium]OJW97400.1 MAG: group 1 glycosyl transferase [Bacteroidetes bacterium 43-93]
MRIAFDAKRAYQNTTGLGNYSRMLIKALAAEYPQHEYYLAAPKQTELFTPTNPNIHIITPTGFNTSMRSMWRSDFVKADLKANNIDIYHGLSNEIPKGIHTTGIKSVVTIHDLIFERYPKQYAAIDTAIYRYKFRYAAKHADKVIAISEQTKQDLIQYYQTPKDKIAVCYQSCDPIFEARKDEAAIAATKAAYGLPGKYFLYVGSVIERKNLLTICKAMAELKNRLPVPLVVIGNGGKYLQQVKEYISKEELTDRVLFLSEQATAQRPSFKNATDFPAIYQGATALIYPSIYEGFGIPILEALWSRLPVITSNLSCLPETGGDAAYYIDPMSVSEMATAMQKVALDESMRATMIDKGLLHAAKFTPEQHAASVMKVYQSLL